MRKSLNTSPSFMPPTSPHHLHEPLFPLKSSTEDCILTINFRLIFDVSDGKPVHETGLYFTINFVAAKIRVFFIFKRNNGVPQLGLHHVQ